MERVFTELPTECDYTAQMFATGLEKKEIAFIKCKAISTISNQLQKAFEVLNVRNGRELSIKFAERISGMKLTMGISPAVKSSVACILLMLLIIDHNMDMRRQRMRSSRTYNNIEAICRVRSRSRGRIIPFTI